MNLSILQLHLLLACSTSPAPRRLKRLTGCCFLCYRTKLTNGHLDTPQKLNTTAGDQVLHTRLGLSSRHVLFLIPMALNMTLVMFSSRLMMGWGFPSSRCKLALMFQHSFAGRNQYFFIRIFPHCLEGLERSSKMWLQRQSSKKSA